MTRIRAPAGDPAADRRDRRADQQREPYVFDRRFLFRILPMGHSQLAEFIGARGPNTHVNAACASTAQGVGPRRGLDPVRRCRRVSWSWRRQPLERQPDGVDRLRLPRHRRGGHGRQGRGRGPALRSPPSRDADGDGGLRHGGGEPGRGRGARDAGDRGAALQRRPRTAPSTPPASTWSTSPAWWRAWWPPPSAATASAGWPWPRRRSSSPTRPTPRPAAAAPPPR